MSTSAQALMAQKHGTASRTYATAVNPEAYQASRNRRKPEKGAYLVGGRSHSRHSPPGRGEGVVPEAAGDGSGEADVGQE